MTPQDLMLHDGVILSYKRDRDGVVMQYRDYADTQWELRFTGEELELYEQDAVGFDFLVGKISKEGNLTKLNVVDDDGKLVFWIKYEKCEITPVKEKP